MDSSASTAIIISYCPERRSASLSAIVLIRILKQHDRGDAPNHPTKLIEAASGCRGLVFSRASAGATQVEATNQHNRRRCRLGNRRNDKIETIASVVEALLLNPK